MRLIRAKNYDDMSLKAANIIAAQVSLNPKSVLGLATGSTPIGTYRHLVEWYQKGELDFGKAVSINLDEYCGLSGDHPQSYRRFMRENLFNHINIPADRSFLPDGTRYTIAIFIKNSAENPETNARIIADISETVYRYVHDEYRENDIRPGKKHVDKGAGIGFESDYFY